MPDVVIPPICKNIVYRKTSRPPVAYSPDIRVVVEGCRADGGEEHAIALLPEIFSSGITENALTRKMTREEASKRRIYNSSSRRVFTQVYRTLLRSDDAGRSHCRLCSADANQNGWKNAKDVLRHLKRDHFGLMHCCPRWLVLAHISKCHFELLTKRALVAKLRTPLAKCRDTDVRSPPILRWHMVECCVAIKSLFMLVLPATARGHNTLVPTF